jgi:hypothetical protein
MLHFPRAVIVVLLLVISGPVGCGSSKSSNTNQTETSIFKEEQSSTITPHGKIDADSVQEGSAGTVEYRTTDGRLWRTDMRVRADGTHSWTQPEEVESSSNSN